jgi:hypothetical protein
MPVMMHRVSALEPKPLLRDANGLVTIGGSDATALPSTGGSEVQRLKLGRPTEASTFGSSRACEMLRVVGGPSGIVRASDAVPARDKI